MDRKTVRLDRQTLEELVERMRETCVNIDLDRCDVDSLTEAIRGISQITRFAKELGFEVSIPDEEPKGRCCGWQPPGAHRIPCRRKEGHTGKHCWGSAMAMAMDEEAVLKPLSDCGDHMTLGYFLDCVESGCFTDDDGFGEYATETQVSGKRVHPSDVFASELDMNYTHVVWYNK